MSQQVAVTDRFQKAVEQLDSDKLNARTAGVFLLERLAKDSPDDHAVIFSVLTSFLTSTASAANCDAAPGELTSRLRPDLQAVLTVITRRDDVGRPDVLDLQKACLPYADLAFARLRNVQLSATNLTYSRLLSADFSSGSFVRANLSHAVLIAANFTDAFLDNANLSGAKMSCASGGEPDPRQCTRFTNAKLTFANLSGAHLQNTILTGAHLEGANLTRADLVGAILTDATLDGAILTDIYYDASTVWPAGFTPPQSRLNR